MSAAPGDAISFHSSYPFDVQVTENVWIPLADGTRLAARLWLPEGADARPVPAILEYLPYRKDDCTARDDELRHPYFAAHGYAAVRVDLRGTGDSDGLLLGEYLEQEHDDALEVLEWLAEQPWCTGDVGMIGYSWGGFNGLQIAARRPPQLKAIITHASTDDRYLDDCHYMGGCMLASDMLKWATSMLTYPLQPPNPRFVGDRWRDMWLYRLENAPELARDWISHQRRDSFWKHGSVSEDYDAIECAVFAVGGWADAYTNAVPRLLENLSAPSIGLIGPWGHMMPHTGVPGPAIGFLNEAVRWWDQWLKGEETGIMGEPQLRAWMQEYVTPASSYAERPGRWVGVEWPSGKASALDLVPEPGGGLATRSGAHAEPTWLTIAGEQYCGETAGVWCANGVGDEMAEDQRPDDECSLVFTTEPLHAAVEVLGRPALELRLRSDRPLALVAARLEDVAPSGEALLVSWDMLNLTHRESHESPSELVPGREYDISFQLRACGHRFAPGHRMRLALSPTYWPHAWPSPEPVALEIAVGGPSRLVVPLLAEEASPAPTFSAPEQPVPLAGAPGDESWRVREVTVDPVTGRHEIADRQSQVRTVSGTGVRYSEHGSDVYEITEGEPLSAVVRCERETVSEGDDLVWSVRVSSRMTCDAANYYIEETYSAHDGDEELFSRSRTSVVKRDHT
jgi:putative CocE/NonD family hydrolase